MAKSEYEIGAMLREARMRAQVDISEIEEQTRIRAKYLRAIENEEWGLLPGPVYAKVFLRTYAEYLNLDAKRILDEYKLHYDQYDELDNIQPKPRRDRKRIKLPGIPARVAIAVVLLLITLLFVVLRKQDDNDNSLITSESKVTNTRKKTRQVTVKIAAKQQTRLCIRNGEGKPLTNNKVLAAGKKTSYSDDELLIRISDRSIKMVINSKPLKIPSGSAPIAYSITPAGSERVALKQVPKC